MKKYRTYTAKKYKIVKKIIFFVVVALIIFALTMVLGNHLKKKLETADLPEHNASETTETLDNDNEEKKEESVPHDSALSGVKAGYLSLEGIKDEAGARAEVQNLKAAGYNAVSFRVTNSEGNITYASPAVVAQSRLPASEGLVPYDVLRVAAVSARESGMRLSCVIASSDSLSDSLMAAELAELGFEEIVVLGYEKYTLLTNEYVEEIRGYIKMLKDAAGDHVCISVSFKPEFYLAAQNAPYIEKMYNSCEFLSIDLAGLSAKEVNDTAVSLQGSFTAYMLRPILDGSNSETAASIDGALSESSVAARQYISAPVKAEDTSEKGTN